MRKKTNKNIRSDFEGCQLYCVPAFATGYPPAQKYTLMSFIKRKLAYPWNRYVKRWLKKIYYVSAKSRGLTSAQKAAKKFAPASSFTEGDLVWVRSKEEILSTLDPFNELKGCSFLPDMYKYCETEQRVFRVMQHFMDERDYKMKKTRGIILLENIFCSGTAVFGKCDRCCFLFWREEWLKKISPEQ